MSQTLLDYFKGNQLAADVWKSKYAAEGEETPNDMHMRMAKELSPYMQKFNSTYTVEVVFDLLKDFKYIVPQGSVMSSLGVHSKVSSLSNCFVIPSPKDSYSGILFADEQLVQLMKRRGGVGVDISTLRPKHTKVNNAAKTSTGAASFMERYSNSTREVAQEGRRGALMLSMDVRHPDIFEFVNIKKDRTKVTGANISVMLRDDFMEAVKVDGEYLLRWPCEMELGVRLDSLELNETYRNEDESVAFRKIKAKELYDQIVENAWENAEPGQMFIDRHWDYSPDGVYEQYRGVTSNPCFVKGMRADVLTDSGLKPIEDITKEDLIWINDLNEFAPNERGYFSTGLNESYHVKFSNGEELFITGYHKLGKAIGPVAALTELRHLKVGDPIKTHEEDIYITYIDYIGIRETGCINVPGFHRMTVNGIVSGNCGEIFMQPYDACRLIAHNLLSYVVNPYTEKAYFDYNLFFDNAYTMQIMADAIVDLELGHIDKILEAANNSKDGDLIKGREVHLWEQIKATAASGRRTGSGLTALGDTLAALGEAYDSDTSLNIVRDIMKVKFIAELKASIDLAAKFGPFEGWDSSLENNSFYRMIEQEFPILHKDLKENGRRNVSWSTVAPTGSLSILTQTSSGLEPMFMPFYTRRRKINPSNADDRVDFVDQNGDKWMEYCVSEPQFARWLKVNYLIDDTSLIPKEELQTYFEKSPWYKSTANDISWERRVQIQGIIQRYTSHSISSTINLPNSATKEDVATIYEKAWTEGLKGVTVYRDGCRTGVLVSDTKKEEFTQQSAPKRPTTLPSDIHHIMAGGNKLTVFVGLMEGKPYEVLCSKGGHYGKKGDAVVTKLKKGSYKAIQQDLEVPILVNLSSEELAITRLVSTSLRHGADIKFVAEQLRKSGGVISAFTNGMARVLSKYVTELVVQESCPECGEKELLMEEGCLKCKACGYSKCG